MAPYNRVAYAVEAPCRATIRAYFFLTVSQRPGRRIAPCRSLTRSSTGRSAEPIQRARFVRSSVVSLPKEEVAASSMPQPHHRSRTSSSLTSPHRNVNFDRTSPKHTTISQLVSAALRNGMYTADFHGHSKSSSMRSGTPHGLCS